MKKGKFILGAAALVVTACSVMSFKTVSKFSLNQLYSLSNGVCNAKACWTRATGNAHTGCLATTLVLRTSQDGGATCATVWNGSRTTVQ